MRVFFIGVCGTAMGNAAVLLAKMGHEVAGSDAGVYPPMSDVLMDAGIDLFEGFEESQMLDWKPDRVVVGNAVSGAIPKWRRLLRTREVPFVSLPQLIGEDLIGSRPSLVVAGTHGKTTTTSLTAYALEQVGSSPVSRRRSPSRSGIRKRAGGGGDSPFVIEGDEYDSAFSTSEASSSIIGRAF